MNYANDLDDPGEHEEGEGKGNIENTVVLANIKEDDEIDFGVLLGALIRDVVKLQQRVESLSTYVDDEVGMLRTRCEDLEDRLF